MIAFLTVMILLAILMYCENIAANQTKTERIILMKVTDLAAALSALDTKITGVQASVDALKASLANVDLPADAQAALDKLTADTGALAADVTPAA